MRPFPYFASFLHIIGRGAAAGPFNIPKYTNVDSVQKQYASTVHSNLHMQQSTVQYAEEGSQILTVDDPDPETHTKRQANQLGCLSTVSSLLGDGVKRIELVYGEEKNILYWADLSNQGRTKISCTDMTSPTNQPRKDLFHLYSLSPQSPQFQHPAGVTPL